MPIPLLIALILASAILLAWTARIVLRARRRWNEWRQRSPVDDDAFVDGCDIPPDAPARYFALVTRRALADAVGVPPETIRSTDPLADHFWDSLDWLDVTFRIEKLGRIKLPKRFVLEPAIARAGGDRRHTQVRHVVQAVVDFALSPGDRNLGTRPSAS